MKKALLGFLAMITFAFAGSTTSFIPEVEFDEDIRLAGNNTRLDRDMENIYRNFLSRYFGDMVYRSYFYKLHSTRGGEWDSIVIGAFPITFDTYSMDMIKKVVWSVIATKLGFVQFEHCLPTLREEERKLYKEYAGVIRESIPRKDNMSFVKFFYTPYRHFTIGCFRWDDYSSGAYFVKIEVYKPTYNRAIRNSY